MRSVIVVPVGDDHESGDEFMHLPNAPDLAGGPPQTLCGWTDVQRVFLYGTVDCPECLKIMRYCRNLKLSYAIDDDPFSHLVR